jgi:hypothetical protein
MIFGISATVDIGPKRNLADAQAVCARHGLAAVSMVRSLFKGSKPGLTHVKAPTNGACFTKASGL